jgi:DNA repair exonuclease SbcCD ATPase subunit
MADPLNTALATLNTTITSITEKVDEQKTRVTNYKTALITKLGQVVQQINDLKNNSVLNSIPQLRQQLQQIPQLQQQLEEKNNELEETKRNLAETNQNLQELQRNIDQLTREIQDKNTQIQQLTQTNQNKDQEINNLNNEIQQLNQQKTAAENALAAANQQMDTLVARIGEINDFLGQQILTINRIADELGDLESGEIGDQFNLIGANLQSIIDLINNGSSGTASLPQAQSQLPRSSQPVSNQAFSPEVEDYYNKFIRASQISKDRFYNYLRTNGKGNLLNTIQTNIRGIQRIPPSTQSEQQIKNVLNGLLNEGLTFNFNNVSGGKRRRKTIKKHHKRTHKKIRGGYVYSSSKELDKASSIISSSSNSKSSSKTLSKSKTKDKTRRKLMK